MFNANSQILASIEQSLNASVYSAAGVEISYRNIIDLLRKCSIKSYVCGGAVRSWLEGEIPTDIDICVNNDISLVSKYLQETFNCKNAELIHYTSFGLLKWGSDSIRAIDINVIRSLEDVGDNFQMGSTFSPRSSLDDDALTRDFTMNALYFCPEKRVFIDPLNGFQDINNRRLRIAIPEQYRSKKRDISLRIIKFMMKGYEATEDIKSYARNNLTKAVQELSESHLQRWLKLQIIVKENDLAIFCSLFEELCSDKNTIFRLQAAANRAMDEIKSTACLCTTSKNSWPCNRMLSNQT